MQKLTIVVNCTDRKSVAPTSDLRMRSLPPGGGDQRFEAWRSRVGSAESNVNLVDLYQGEAWLQAKGLADDARARGAQVRMMVASAGLGLRDVTLRAPSYAATFAAGHADSVSIDVRHTSDWWNRLSALPGATTISRIAGDPVLMVLSESYARAMDADLTKLAQRGGDYMLVGGWRSIDGLPRLQADRDLRRTLGGTVSSVSLRMARKWMGCRTSSALHSKADAKRWSKWAAEVRHSELYQRAQLTDADLTEIIGSLIREEPTLSASRALRILRDRGMACEQQRFGTIFQKAAAIR